MGLFDKELKAVWVFENSRKNRTFYITEVELLYLVASVTQWKKFNPKIPACLVCTPEVHQKFCDLDLIYLWDHVDIEILLEIDTIDRVPFWACSKIKAMRKISAPFVMMDNDLFLTQGNVMSEEDYRDLGVVVSHRESGPGYYLLSSNPSFAGLEGLYPVDYTGSSFNVSFLYVRDDDFRSRYSERAYEWMTHLSDGRTDIHGGHMIFCEQKLLYDMVVSEKVPHKTVIAEAFDCRRNQFERVSLSQKLLNHLGPQKRHLESDPNLYTVKKSEVLFAIKDYYNIKHVFLALKRNEQNRYHAHGKFFLSSRLNPWIEPSHIKHENRAENKICVFYSLWEEYSYLPYLKYSLMSLISSTDVRAKADILIFVSENLHYTAIKCLEGLVSEESFVVIKDIKAFKYILPSHPRLQKYSYFMMLDSDAFFVGRNLVFKEIEEYYSRPDSPKTVFMVPDFHDASLVFYTRKKDLCKSLDNSEYESFFRKKMGNENFEKMLSNKWWISCSMIYTRDHFREEAFHTFVFEQLWLNQMCDETVFIAWAWKQGYEIENISRFFNCYDRFIKKPDLIALYHPIVGENTMARSNQELIELIEKNYDSLNKSRVNS